MHSGAGPPKNINWLVARNDSAGRALLERAKARIASVDVLGLTERCARSRARAFRCTEWCGRV